VTFVPVSKNCGAVDPLDILGAVRPNTCLITLMLANNETGLLQPVREIGQSLIAINKERTRKTLPRVLFHTDAAQAIGKIQVDVHDLGVDYLTIVGHKFYGPRIGALYRRRGVPLHPLLFGGGQEMGLRPGTENTPIITGLGKAADLVAENITEYNNRMQKLQAYFEDQLVRSFGDTILINGRDINKYGRLPNTVSVSFKGGHLKGRAVLKLCPNIVASVGAACHSSGGDEPSTVLVASGVDPELASNTLRLSIGRETKQTDLNIAINDIKKALASISTID
jgi:selenocysteine lyase